jgi:diketogulonate reductase-like aldo/keto reductase
MSRPTVQGDLQPVLALRQQGVAGVMRAGHAFHFFVDASTIRPMRSITVSKGQVRWPALGLGTWRLGENLGTRSAEMAAVRQAIDIGYRLIDTAEMYGDGGAESVVGDAVARAVREGACRREDLVIVSKVLPSNASSTGTVAACERSLQRLRCDWIDLYLLHWPGAHPLTQTLAGFARLRARGLIRHWGVSNFDFSAIQHLVGLRGGDDCAANQVCYSLSARGIDHDLRPWQRSRGMPVMAYCPIDQGSLAHHAALSGLARPLGLSAAQLALAWTMRDGDVMAIPKSVR